MRRHWLKTLNTFVDFLGEFPEPDSPDEVPGKELAEVLANGYRNEDTRSSVSRDRI